MMTHTVCTILIDYNLHAKFKLTFDALRFQPNASTETINTVGTALDTLQQIIFASFNADFFEFWYSEIHQNYISTLHGSATLTGS